MESVSIINSYESHYQLPYYEPFAEQELMHQHDCSALLDCLDDQAVIDEIKLQIDRERSVDSSLWESDVHQPWGGAFRNRSAQKNTKARRRR
jgi:hypothetical protein